MRAARALLHGVGRVLERLNTAFSFLSAATLPLHDLRRAQAAYWSDFALHDDDIDRGWFTWEREVAAEFLRPDMRVLLAGCGSGRDLIEFARRGCDVTGVDMAEAPLRRAREKLVRHGLDARLIHAWIEDLPLDAKYDAVWFSWLTYAYVPMASRRVAALRRLASHLLPGGIVVLNILRTPPRARVITLARGVARACRSGWLLEPGDVVTRMPGVGNYHYQHVFATGEAERELEEAGLDLVSSLHDATTLVAVPCRRPRTAPGARVPSDGQPFPSDFTL